MPMQMQKHARNVFGVDFTKRPYDVGNEEHEEKTRPDSK